MKNKAVYIALHGKPISKLRSVTCHMGSHSVMCHPKQVNMPCLDLQPERPVLDLSTPEIWKAELTLVVLNRKTRSVHQCPRMHCCNCVINYQ